MKVGTMIELLQLENEEEELIVFCEGKLYPTLAVQKVLNNMVEIGCGWADLDIDD